MESGSCCAPRTQPRRKHHRDLVRAAPPRPRTGGATASPSCQSSTAARRGSDDEGPAGFGRRSVQLPATGTRPPSGAGARRGRFRARPPVGIARRDPRETRRHVWSTCTSLLPVGATGDGCDTLLVVWSFACCVVSPKLTKPSVHIKVSSTRTVRHLELTSQPRVWTRNLLTSRGSCKAGHSENYHIVVLSPVLYSL
jgi:hypothetical protein